MSDECSCAVVWAFFGIAFLWDWNETDLFHSCGHFWVFQICWHIECSTFTAASFRIWNSSVGIPSPPLALFVVMLPKTHLTLHSRMSGSRLVITPSWLSGSWRSSLYSSSMYCCYLFLISASVRSIPFLSFIVPIFAWNVPALAENELLDLEPFSDILSNYWFQVTQSLTITVFWYLSEIQFSFCHLVIFTFRFCKLILNLVS